MLKYLITTETANVVVAKADHWMDRQDTSTALPLYHSLTAIKFIAIGDFKFLLYTHQNTALQMSLTLADKHMVWQSMKKRVMNFLLF